MRVPWIGVVLTVGIWIGAARAAISSAKQEVEGSTRNILVLEEEDHGDDEGGQGGRSSSSGSLLYGIRLRTQPRLRDDDDDLSPRIYVRATTSARRRISGRRRLQSLHYNLFDLANLNKMKETGPSSSKSPKSLTSARPSSSPSPSTTYVPTTGSRSSKSPKGYDKATRSPSSSKAKKGSLAPTASLVPTQTAVPSYSYSPKHKLSPKSKRGSLYPTASLVPTQTAVPSYSHSSKHGKHGPYHTKSPKELSSPSRSPKGSSSKGSPVPTSSPVPTAPTTPSPSSISTTTKRPTFAPTSPTTQAPAGSTSAAPVPTSVSPNTITSPVAAAPSAPPQAASPTVTGSPAAPAASAAPVSTNPTAAAPSPSLGSPVATPSGTAAPSDSSAAVPPTVSAPAGLAGTPTYTPSATTSSPPAVRSGGQSTVRSFVLGVTYELGTAPSAPELKAGDFQSASDVTLAHLDRCLQSSPAGHVVSSKGQVVGTSSDSPVQIEYEVSVEFVTGGAGDVPSPNSLPTSEQVQLIFEACLEGPHETQLLQSMGQELDASNPFSTVKSVSYTAEGLPATDSATPPPELSSENANNSSQTVPVTPFYMSFAQVQLKDSQDLDDVRTITRNHIYVCLRHQYNRSVDVDGLYGNLQSTVPLVQLNWTGTVALPWTLATTIPTALEVSNDIVRCFEDPILNEVFIRKLQNLPESNGFSTTLSVSCSISEPASEASQTSGNSKLSPGAIAGIAVAAVVYVITHAVCFYYLYQKRRSRSRTDCAQSAAPSQPNTALAWVQLGGPTGWWARRFGGSWQASRRGRTTESDVPRLLNMPYHHSHSGSTSRDSSRKGDDENLNYFMREIDTDVIRTLEASTKKARQARL